MKELQSILIVETISSGLLYVNDIIERGYQPIVIFPEINASQDDQDLLYTGLRERAVNELPEGTIVIYEEGVEKLLKELQSFDIVCVVAGSEKGVILADKLAARLNLPGNPVESSILHLHKSEMQEALKQHGVRSIRSRLVHNVEEARAFWAELGVSKAVIKPPASAGTVGLHFCASQKEVEEAVEEEIKKPDFFGVRSDSVLMQEFIAGTEYIVNTVSCNKIHRVTDVWVYNKVAVGNNGNAYDYAKLITKLDAGHSQLIRYAYQVLDALDFKYGPSHGEYMLTSTGPVLIEVGARPMGGKFPKELLDRALGHHITDVSLDTYLAPEKFEKDRQKEYRPREAVLNKFFINPREAHFQSFPIISLLKGMKSFYSADLRESILNEIAPKTIDLETTPGNVLLCDKDENVVEHDYHVLHIFEEKCFSLLFASENNAPRANDNIKASQIVYQIFENDGKKIRMLLNSADDIMEDENSCIEYITVDMLKESDSLTEIGVFNYWLPEDLESCVHYLFEFIKTIQPGGKILIAPELNESISMGKYGWELLLLAAGITIEVPQYGMPECVIGTV